MGLCSAVCRPVGGSSSRVLVVCLGVRPSFCGFRQQRLLGDRDLLGTCEQHLGATRLVAHRQVMENGQRTSRVAGRCGLSSLVSADWCVSCQPLGCPLLVPCPALETPFDKCRGISGAMEMFPLSGIMGNGREQEKGLLTVQWWGARPWPQGGPHRAGRVRHAKGGTGCPKD